jgi:GNAT superfamily N-acetyltransferase
MRGSDAAGGGVVLRDLAIGDAGWIIEQHATLYARDEGYDATFEALVAEILAAYIRSHDPVYERAFIACRAGQRLGSVFCVRQSDEVAKLRLFLITPEARGLGLGRRMLADCMAFARAAGYRRMTLWTHESHRAACALYRAAGFQLVSQSPTHAFGCDVVDQSWVVDL